MSDHSRAANLKFPGGNAGDPMTFEFVVPGDWPPGACAHLRGDAGQSPGRRLSDCVPVRKDATPEQIDQVFEGVRALVECLGLATAQAENPSMIGEGPH